MNNGTITGSLINTVKITVPATVLVVLIGAAAGYALAWIASLAAGPCRGRPGTGPFRHEPL